MTFSRFSPGQEPWGAMMWQTEENVSLLILSLKLQTGHCLWQWCLHVSRKSAGFCEVLSCLPVHKRITKVCYGLNIVYVQLLIMNKIWHGFTSLITVLYCGNKQFTNVLFVSNYHFCWTGNHNPTQWKIHLWFYQAYKPIQALQSVLRLWLMNTASAH